MTEIKDIKLYNIEEAAKLIGVCKRTMHTYIKAGRIKARKIGGRWTLTEKSIAEFLTGTDN